MKVFREYLAEILAVMLALLGVFLLVEQFEIRQSLASAFFSLVEFLKQSAFNLQSRTLAYLTNFTISDFVGWVLIILTSIFIVWRVRYRFSKAEQWRETECPRCGGVLNRVHRGSLDRLISWMLLPRAGRYRCADPECNWSGLRRRQRSLN